MPFENDPLRPPSKDGEGGPPQEPKLVKSRLRSEGTSQGFGQSTYPNAEARSIHSRANLMLYSLVIFVSCCCLFTDFATTISQEPEKQTYSEEQMNARIIRLYQTGYDPLMSYGARTAWLENRGEPNLAEIGGLLYTLGRHTQIIVFVKRGPVYETDIVSFTDDGLIQRYEANFNYRITPFFTDAATRIDASVYPTSVDQIPEEFSPQ